MKNKASVAHDFMKVSRDLEEALARGAFSACELRIIAWLKSRTYGVRIKGDDGWFALDAIPITASFVSSDTGLHKGRVKESITGLLNDHVLRRKANGWLGINSRLSDWKRSLAGRDFDFNRKPRTDIGQRTWDKVSPGQGVPGNGGQGVPGNGGQVVPGVDSLYMERARVETVEREIVEKPQTLPTGKSDTPTTRAEAGLADFPPMDHPAYARLSFKVQDRLAERWEARVIEERKKTDCRKGCGRPRAGAEWPFCRACTACARCHEKADGKRTFTLIKNEVICNDCKKSEAI